MSVDSFLRCRYPHDLVWNAVGLFVWQVDIVVEEGMPIAQPAFFGFDAAKPDKYDPEIAIP